MLRSDTTSDQNQSISKSQNEEKFRQNLIKKMPRVAETLRP